MYPKVCTHRENPHAKVVVMSADQEAALPPEYRSADAARSVGTAGQADVLLSPAYDEVLAAREELEAERTRFAEHMTEQQRDLAQGREQLATDRSNLTAGYKTDKAKLDADRAALDEERAKWEAQKNAAQPPSVATPVNEALAAAPAKRTRVAKE